MIITIDGPAGSGKSSVAKALAERLNIYYLNTGLLYRAVGFIWLKEYGDVCPDGSIQILQSKIHLRRRPSGYGAQAPRTGHTEGSLSFIKNIEYKYVNNLPEIFYENKNITQELLNNSLSQAASILSSVPEVRRALLDLQRNVAKKYNIVCEGRDCGSVIFPNADYKFYLIADLNIRAKRIFEDKSRKGSGLTLEKVKEELEVRDHRDKTRAIAPLIIPDGAIIIDNSKLNQDETLDLLLSLIKFD